MSKTSKYIVISEDGKFLTPRRNMGEMYKNRSGWSDSIDDAKVFQNKAAAKNSATKNGAKNYKVHAVCLTIVDDINDES